jgi:hypothetical protein
MFFSFSDLLSNHCAVLLFIQRVNASRQVVLADGLHLISLSGQIGKIGKETKKKDDSERKTFETKLNLSNKLVETGLWTTETDMNLVLKDFADGLHLISLSSIAKSRSDAMLVAGTTEFDFVF